MVALLLERGANIEAFTDQGTSVTDLACEAERWDAFDILTEAANRLYPYRRKPLQRPGAGSRCFFPSEFFVQLRIHLTTSYGTCP
jgi:hypothetical protein